MTDMVEAMRDSAAVVAARHNSDTAGIEVLLDYGDTLGIVLNLADLVLVLAARAAVPVETLIATIRKGADSELP
ncbi:hypothetical protein [Nocardia sp. NPDC051833]|uniref:hypothetical protein n=1 Tax=Nocardia sp. NPDC051833 TaxID=3155674 RepID=UPI00342AAD81